MIKFLIGGSPCTHWSIAQSKNREVTASGVGWELFKNYLIAKEKFKPDYFLYENNKSVAKAIKNQILSYALRGVPKDEKIVVLSMYDGIETGRYCFDQLGYRNIEYYAYEIDKFAIQVAMSNYPDIV